MTSPKLFALSFGLAVALCATLGFFSPHRLPAPGFMAISR
jgi:hypothetical protein